MPPLGDPEPGRSARPAGASAEAPAIVVSDRLVGWPGPAAVYRPPSLAVGVGCSRGASAAEILDLIDRALRHAGLSDLSVSALASVDLKGDEPGLLQAAAARGWPLRLHPAEALAAVSVPNPSDVVRDAVGTPSVAEAAALLTAGSSELVVEKLRSAMATVAVARRPVRGRLALVSLGPGDDGLLPPLAREALHRAAVIVGYHRYLDQVRHLLRPGTEIVPYELGEEVERCRHAIARASAGAAVALVSSGDVGVYAMASPLLEAGGLGRVDVTVIPGVTAAQAAAALVGSPLGHDHCAISLSDLLTPWEVIRRRIEAAAEGDFAIALYNPRSRRRTWQLDEARAILLAHRAPETPVALVTDAYRPDQRVALGTLGGFDASGVGMTTTIVVGSSQTRLVEGRMVTPRGYIQEAIA
jgi:cobalt-precorrin 5A hydrolase/precorrin-3B C17-methyltransferase